MAEEKWKYLNDVLQNTSVGGIGEHLYNITSRYDTLCIIVHNHGNGSK